ncbi:MAG: hypothetical protein HRF40_00485 [Nitrososphaera sp.]|jgi:hypothetical protein
MTIENSSGNLALPVLFGLAVGAAFVLLFGLFMNTVAGSNPPAYFIGMYPQATISISGLKDSYSVGEPLNFTLSASRYGTNCIEDPEIQIADSYHVLVWDYETFNLMGCGDPDHNNPHKIIDSWSTAKRLDEPSHLDKPGKYTMTATYYGKTVEKQFYVSLPSPAVTAPIVDDIDCKLYSDPATEPSVCLFSRVPDMTLSVAGDKNYFGDKGSFCATDVCVDTVFIVPEKLIRIEKGAEIAFEAANFRQPEQVGVLVYKDENRQAFDDLQLMQLTDNKFKVDLPDGDYILQVSVNWMKGEYSEMSASYYYKIRVS